MGDCIVRMDASRARVGLSFALARSIRIRLEFWCWFIETPVNTRSLYMRRPMAPVGVEVGWLPRPRLGDFIARIDASRARVLLVRYGVIDSYKA